MSLYCIGDLQGCLAPFERLLEKINFSPSRDTLYVLGDLVNRGPDSLGVLRRLSMLGESAQCVLGNHDLHLLALSQGLRKINRKDTIIAQLNQQLLHKEKALQQRDAMLQKLGQQLRHYSATA